MPRPTNPTEGLSDDKTVKILITADVATLRRLDLLIDDEPDIASRSAAVRKLARDWEQRRRKSARKAAKS